MFEEIAPGYYDKYYRLDSTFSHPDLGSNAYKVKLDEQGIRSLDQGVEYKADGFTRNFNQLVVVILGGLRSFNLLFEPANWSIQGRAAWEEAIERMQQSLDSHIAFKGGENDWHRLSAPLANPK
jgi:hypothetical protein